VQPKWAVVGEHEDKTVGRSEMSKSLGVKAGGGFRFHGPLEKSREERAITAPKKKTDPLDRLRVANRERL